MRIACLIPEDAVYASTQSNLAQHGFECSRHTDDASLLHLMHRSAPDIIVVDVGLDTSMEDRLMLWMDGSLAPQVPLVLQTPDLRPDRVARALLAGVDDVVRRSTDVVEFVARLRASVRRRCGRESTTKIDVDGFHFDRSTGRASNRGEPVDLTAREFALAWLLFSQVGTCLSRKTISVVVWGLDEDISNRSMEQHIHRLRRKLGLHESRGVTIRAIYGKGYRIAVRPANRQEIDTLRTVVRPGSIGDVRGGRSELAATHLRGQFASMLGPEGASSPAFLSPSTFMALWG